MAEKSSRPIRNLRDLRNYNMWIDKAPQAILNALSLYSGSKWTTLFAGKPVPADIHRVRNFFNVTPTKLQLLRGSEAEGIRKQNKFLSKGIYRILKGVVYKELDPILTAVSLTGDVYRDPADKRIWWQMAPGATIYHVGSGQPKYPSVEAALATKRGQKATIFKLISPDGTGGSHEVIIKNPGRKETIGTGEPVPITSNLLEDRQHLKGSYNYAETWVQGLPAHEKMDVLTHKRFKGKIYVNPKISSSPLKGREFPEKSYGIPIATLPDLGTRILSKTKKTRILPGFDWN